MFARYIRRDHKNLYLHKRGYFTAKKIEVRLSYDVTAEIYEKQTITHVTLSKPQKNFSALISKAGPNFAHNRTFMWHSNDVNRRCL